MNRKTIRFEAERVERMRQTESLPALQLKLHQQTEERRELQLKLKRLDGDIKSTKEQVCDHRG